MSHVQSRNSTSKMHTKRKRGMVNRDQAHHTPWSEDPPENGERPRNSSSRRSSLAFQPQSMNDLGCFRPDGRIQAQDQPAELIRPSFSTSSSYQPRFGTPIPSPNFGDDIVSHEAQDSLHEVVFALDFKKKDSVGCCYYVASEERLYVLSDIKHGNVDIIGSRW